MLGIFLDIETTGLNPLRHRPIELAFDVIDFSKNKKIFTYHAVIKQPTFIWETKDPKSVEINGFTFAEIKGGRDLKEINLELEYIFKELSIERANTAFICQNPAFDRTFFSQIVPTKRQEELKWPYHWLDLASMYWGVSVFTSKEKHGIFPETIALSKNKIAECFKIPPEASPHRAKAGVAHLIACYEALFDLHFD